MIVGRTLLRVLLGLPAALVSIHTLVRIVRYFWKFPMPEFMADFIDNPLRRKLQPPMETAIRHGIEPGMRVLDVGPGNGTYTIAAARRVGPDGEVVAIDIEPRMVDRVRRRVEAEGIQNLEPRVANLYELPYEDGYFDAATLIAVIGEIPEPERAMREIWRVLKPGGIMALSEVITDPDYTLASTLRRWAEGANFQFERKVGSFYLYSVVFRRANAAHPDSIR
jgi:ubiquinone/menaquinone biosynthesis C-methylase UbiE